MNNRFPTLKILEIERMINNRQISEFFDEISVPSNRFGCFDDIISLVRPITKFATIEIGYYGQDFSKKDQQRMLKSRILQFDTLIITSDPSCFGIDRKILMHIINMHPDDFKCKIQNGTQGCNNNPLVKYYLRWD